MARKSLYGSTLPSNIATDVLGGSQRSPACPRLAEIVPCGPG